MKKVLFPLAIAATLIIACDDNKPKTGYDLARDNARSFVRYNLGPDSMNYEEGSWGQIEPRPVDFRVSPVYRVYADSLGWMENRLTLINDSISKVTNTKTPDYLILTTRRDRYQRELEEYRMRESELQRMYNDKPEYDGYWLYHEYILNGEPKRVYILLGDTVRYTPTNLIYK